MEEKQKQKKSYVCKFCDRSFSNGKNLGGHLRRHLPLISAIRKQSVKEHEEESINGGLGIQFDVETIKKSEDCLSNSYILRENPKKSWRVSNSNPICKQCGKVLHSLRVFSSHKRSYSLKSKVSIKKNLCTKCGKSFDSMKALYGHMKCHAMKKSQPSNQSSSSSQDCKFHGGVKEEISNPIIRKRSCTRYKYVKHNEHSSCTSLSSFGSIGECNDDDDDEVEEGALCLMMLSMGLDGGKMVISSE